MNDTEKVPSCQPLKEPQKRAHRWGICWKVAVVVLAVVFVGALIAPSMGRWTPDLSRKHRCLKLQRWCDSVKSFAKQKGRLPVSLFEMCQDDFKKGTWPFPSPWVEEDRLDKEWPSHDASLSEEEFARFIEYALLTGPQGWIVRELKPGRVYKKMLMIDQDGRIYEISELPKEKYSHP